eukprot:9022308-Lingulodinium_polyedra.AAC.1
MAWATWAATFARAACAACIAWSATSTWTARGMGGVVGNCCKTAWACDNKDSRDPYAKLIK